MKLIEWEDNFTVGVDKFDKQHQKLIDLINQLYTAMKLGEGSSKLSEVLGGLVSYTQTHFTDEETMMQARGYPGLSAHKALHKHLVEKIVEIQTRLQAGASSTLTLETMNFLKSWLMEHILKEDKKYGEFFNL